jgi:hypothetical protein
MTQTVQLAISDGAYSAAVRDALCRSCAWRIDAVQLPDFSRSSVLVLDEPAFTRLPLPLSHPERVVLITRKDTHQMMAQAWEAGIVSVVSADDPIDTVLLAIMAASLRVAKSGSDPDSGEFSPISAARGASVAPHNRTSGSKRCKIQ